jgi:hypothetical protein
VTATTIWDEVAEGARRESPLWAAALRPEDERELEAVFSPLGDDRRALGVETIYEGYLLHYGRPRLFAPPAPEEALLLGDYLYAHGLVRVAELHNVRAVADLAALISVCAQLRAEGGDGDGAAWAATAALAGENGLSGARDALRLRGDSDALLSLARAEVGDEAVDGALAAHRRRVS